MTKPKKPFAAKTANRKVLSRGRIFTTNNYSFHRSQWEKTLDPDEVIFRICHDASNWRLSKKVMLKRGKRRAKSNARPAKRNDHKHCYTTERLKVLNDPTRRVVQPRFNHIPNVPIIGFSMNVDPVI